MITATVVGLIGVLEFHTRPSAISVATIPAAGASTASLRSGPPRAASTTGECQGTKSPRRAPRPGRARPRRRPAHRTATGPQVNYSWGVLSVSVTVSGTKVTKVGIGSLNDGGNPRSQSIDQNSIPQLEQQAVAAQSANIQGVSGASYTSAGFKQSLQAALQQLGVG